MVPLAGHLLALVCAIALTAGLLHLTTPGNDRLDTSPAAAAQRFADAAAAAFAGTVLASDDTLSPEARSVNIPTDPVAGWDLPTSDGRTAQLALPGGLGNAETTPAGQVVYPDRGADFSVIAENQGARWAHHHPHPPTLREHHSSSGDRYRRWAEVADGPDVPADPRRHAPVSHTNGIITLNQANRTATTIATIAAPRHATATAAWCRQPS